MHSIERPHLMGAQLLKMDERMGKTTLDFPPGPLHPGPFGRLFPLLSVPSGLIILTLGLCRSDLGIAADF